MSKNALATQGGRSLPELRRTQYDPAIRDFNRWNENRPVTEERLREYMADRKARFSIRSNSLAKVALKQAVLRAFPVEAGTVEFCGKMDTLFRSIKTGSANPAVSDADVVSQEDIARLLEAMPDRLRLFTLALYETGFRISELTGALLKDCEVNGRAVAITVIGKGSKERTVSIDRALFDEIVRTFGSKKYLFQNARSKSATVKVRGQAKPRRNPGAYSREYFGREIKKHSIAVLGRAINPHRFRHSRATHMLDRGVPLVAVSRFLGHARADFTARVYAHNLVSAETQIETGLAHMLKQRSAI